MRRAISIALTAALAAVALTGCNYNAMVAMRERIEAAWAQGEFGSLDAKFTEIHRFEMQLFSFAEG